MTNEGNGDLTQTLPRVHIVLASIEKVVPTLEDVSQLLRVLARSATAQEMSVYTTLSTGPRREGDPDGPNEYHVIILDNGRTAMLGGQMREMLRCIRCGACMNHCPVYAAVGGHTYGWVYPGPMGAVLTPSIVGIENAGHLPNASTFCGRCEEVCPVRIPLPKLMRHWREREFERNLSPATVRSGLAAWGFLAMRPRLYAVAMSLAVFGLGLIGKALRPLPLAAARRRLDAAPRFSRARCADVPGAVETTGAVAMTARSTLFASIRQSLGVTGDEPARRAAVAERLKQHPRGVIPARGQLPPHERVKLFAEMVEAAAGIATMLPSADDVPAAITALLRRHNLPMQIRRGDDPRLGRLPWEQRADAGGLDRRLRRPPACLGILCVRRRRRDRNARHGVGAGQSDHAQFPARYARGGGRR